MSVVKARARSASSQRRTITYRQFDQLRTRGAFGQRLRRLGSGHSVRRHATPDDLAGIDQITTEYRDLLNEFEERYGHLVSGARWVELGGAA